MTEEQKWTAPAATGNGPSNPKQGYTRIVTPNSMEEQAMKAIEKMQDEQDQKAMANIAKAFTREEWHNILRIAPAQVLADELAKRATHGERVARRMAEVYEEEQQKWK